MSRRGGGGMERFLRFGGLTGNLAQVTCMLMKTIFSFDSVFIDKSHRGF